MNIVFLGPPGSGKGTQAKRLASSHGLTHLSTGDVFREAIGSQSPLGTEIKSFVDSGRLVPDELVSEVVFEKLKKMEGRAGFLLDGYPRTLDQVNALDGFVQRHHISIDFVFLLDVESDELVKRLSARRYCPSCKEVFNLMNRPPRIGNKCDVCGAGLVHRDDDRAEIVSERLRIYSKQTEPIVAHYETHPGFFKINAARNIETVYSDIVKVIDGKNSSLRRRQ